MPLQRKRADVFLVEAGFFESRASAQAAIKAGLVTADGAPVTRPAQRLDTTMAITAEPAHSYVSRGGLKLAHALESFGLLPAGLVCLDLGASTGGFTDVLLQRGAARVFAVDVGTAQFHASLRSDARISLFENQDVRTLTDSQIAMPPDLIVADLSFISLEKALGQPLTLARQGANLVALFKPQFQVGRDHVGKKGIVTDQNAVSEATDRFEAWLIARGWPVVDWIDSPILGGDGNQELLVHARHQGT